MVSQQALWLYSVIHSGRLGADRNKGHEIVMRQCDGSDYDDRAAGNPSFLFYSLKSENDRPMQSSL